MSKPVAKERGFLPTAQDGKLLEMIADKGWESFCEGLTVDYRPAAIRRVLHQPAKPRGTDDWVCKTRDDVTVDRAILLLGILNEEWSEHEQLQMTSALIDESTISQMEEWDGGWPHEKGLGYIIDGSDGSHPDPPGFSHARQAAARKNEDKANTKNQKIKRKPEVCLQKSEELKTGYRQRLMKTLSKVPERIPLKVKLFIDSQCLKQ
ncbi:hypothetical protein AgCh_038527 [Apium graveolens]